MNLNQRLSHALSRTIFRPKSHTVTNFNQGVLRNQLPKACAVYALLRDGEVVYIGKAVNLKRRLSSHKYYKEGMKIAYILVQEDELDWYESVLIDRYKPMLNTHIRQLHYRY